MKTKFPQSPKAGLHLATALIDLAARISRNAGFRGDNLPLAIKSREKHGDRCAELDAIPATELRRRVSETIESHITSRDEWERLQRVEASERETLDQFIAGLEGAA